MDVALIANAKSRNPLVFRDVPDHLATEATPFAFFEATTGNFPPS
jgi:hypothetical protein